MSKRAAFAILSFLESSIKDGSIRSDDSEGIEVAMQCISEAFDVSLTSPTDDRAYSIAPATLPSVLESHVLAASIAAPVPGASDEPVTPTKVPTADEKAQAEKSKSLGNQLMASKDYQGAIEAYTQAIELDGSNKVYWSNRAAAHSQLQSHGSAINDARKALEIDPSFSKAYSRLGHALFSSGQYAESVEAYEQGLVLDPTNATMKSSLSTARSRVASSSAAHDEDDEDEADTGSAAARSPGAAGGMPAGFPGFPGMGAGGGMPDLASLMSNPAIMGMAQQMMANGGMEGLMNNPMLQQMMSGGGMPDMSALMQDPTMRRMAEQMGALQGGAGGAGAAGAPANEGTNGDMYS